MKSEAQAPDITVDARGMACPKPVIELAKAVRGMSAGTVATVLCTDEAARIDVPAWARLTGNEFVGEVHADGEKQKDGGAFALTVRLLG
jgi:TusA-related sulfurtransferase